MTDEERFSMMQAHTEGVIDIPGPIPKRERVQDKTSMTYWFPLIETAGLPVPKTVFVEMTDTARRMVYDIFDGKEGGDANAEPFFDQIAEAAGELGYPCFLRSDHTSNKHSWKRACYLESQAGLPAHVLAIAEFSECVWLPWDTWTVREMLPTIPYGVCPGYHDFPVCKEFRFFVNEGDVICWHPYWPLESLQQGGWVVDADEATAYAELCSVDYPTLMELKDLASKAGVACGGAWSVDILETERGWFITDMAEAHKSFHWEGCDKQ